MSRIEQSRPTSVLNSLEIDWTIEFFLYYMDGETRRKLMVNLPQVYDKLMGRSIMDVRVPNPEPTPEPLDHIIPSDPDPYRRKNQQG